MNRHGALSALSATSLVCAAGWWLAIMHITRRQRSHHIIGIPFAWAHVKLALASLFPVGKTVVEVDGLKLLPGAGTGLRV